MRPLVENHSPSIVASNELEGFYAVALKTCEVDSESFEKYLRKVVSELISEGFTAQDAQMVCAP